MPDLTSVTEGPAFARRRDTTRDGGESRGTVSVLIVTYECRDAVRACLRSLRESAGAVELVVVDNASSDGTVEMLKREFPEARVVPLAENVGFAAGVNRAAALAEGEYLLLLNPDVVVHPGAVEHLVEYARAHPGHGLYGGRTLWPDGSVCPGSCWGAPSPWSLLCFATMLSTAFKGSSLLDPESLGSWPRDTVREVPVVTGCLLLLQRSLWLELGGFDERYFMYGEDVDLSLRVAKRGLRPVIVPDAIVTHTVGVSSGTRPERAVLVLRGKATVLRTHWPRGKRELGLGLLWLGVGVRALLASALAGRAAGQGGSIWLDAWRGRGRWLGGYPPVARR